MYRDFCRLRLLVLGFPFLLDFMAFDELGKLASMILNARNYVQTNRCITHMWCVCVCACAPDLVPIAK